MSAISDHRCRAASMASRCTRPARNVAPDELRQRACTELLRQAAQTAGLLAADDRTVDGRRDQRGRGRRDRSAAGTLVERPGAFGGSVPKAFRSERAVLPGRRAHPRAAHPVRSHARCRRRRAAQARRVDAARRPLSRRQGGRSLRRGRARSGPTVRAAPKAAISARWSPRTARPNSRASFSAIPRSACCRASCTAASDCTLSRCLAREPGAPQSFDAVRGAVAMSLRQLSYVTALRQYLRLLAGAAAVKGVDLDAADTPLVQ